jgi:hypothetical protein
MKMPFKIARMLAVAMLIAVPAAFAQSDPKTDPNQLKAMEMAMKMDMNHDGMISREEFMKAMEARWNAMDTGKKGMVTLDVAARNMLFLKNEVGTQ